MPVAGFCSSGLEVDCADATNENARAATPALASTFHFFIESSRPADVPVNVELQEECRTERAVEWSPSRFAAVAGTVPATRSDGGTNMLLTLAIVLFILWALGLFAFHVTSGLIHLLVVLAVISLIVHLFRGPRTA